MGLDKIHKPGFTLAHLETIFQLCNKELNSPSLITSPTQRKLITDVLISCGNIIKRNKND